jgi:hypothetical protein
MKSVLIQQEQNFGFSLDTFYRVVKNTIDQANPYCHMSCDFLSDPLAFGIFVFPVKVYETIRSLRNGNDPVC